MQGIERQSAAKPPPSLSRKRLFDPLSGQCPRQSLPLRHVRPKDVRLNPAAQARSSTSKPAHSAAPATEAEC